MTTIKNNIILIYVIAIMTSACAQSKQTFISRFTPNHSIEDIVNKEVSFQSIEIDSLYITNSNIDSVLSHIIDNVLPSKTIWVNLHLVFAKINEKTYLEIHADYSNRQLFINKGWYYEYKLYGYLNFKNKFIYVSTQNIPVDEIDFFLGKTEKKSSIKMTPIDQTLEIMKFENPMWLYELDHVNITLIKSVNVGF